MCAVKIYLDIPTIKNRLKIGNVTYNNKLKNLVVAFKNIITSKKTMVKLYDKYNQYQTNSLINAENKRKMVLELKNWVNSDFPEIINDTNMVINYLKEKGYVEIE